MIESILITPTRGTLSKVTITSGSESYIFYSEGLPIELMNMEILDREIQSNKGEKFTLMNKIKEKLKMYAH